MNKNTNINIDGNKVEVRLSILIENAQMAVGLGQAEVERELGKIQRYFAYNYNRGGETAINIGMALSASDYLKTATDNLNKAIKILQALEYAKEREEFIVVREQE